VKSGKGVIPRLASSWEDKGDGTWRFHLREGVTFSDGSAFDAADVKASYERATSDKLTCETPRYFGDTKLTLEVVDEHTVRLAFGPSDVFEEGDDHTWLAGLGGAADRAIDALARVPRMLTAAMSRIMTKATNFDAMGPIGTSWPRYDENATARVATDPLAMTRKLVQPYKNAGNGPNASRM